MTAPTPIGRRTVWGPVREKPRSEIGAHQFLPESEEERQHFENTPRVDVDLAPFRDANVEREFVSWNGRIYRCTGRHQCGYHMTPVDHDGQGRRHCISERAIGRTYQKIWKKES